MFVPPECTMEGEFSQGCSVSFSSVHIDPEGCIWAVDSCRTRVFRFSAAVLNMNLARGAPLPSSKDTDELNQPCFECDDNDRVLTVAFAAANTDLRPCTCVATTGGCLALGYADSFSTDIRQVRLGGELTALTAVPRIDKLPERKCTDEDNESLETSSICRNGDGYGNGGLLTSSFDGTFSEVLLVQWGNDVHNDVDQPRGSDVSTVGLFRVEGRVCGLTVDEAAERIVTVNERGEVDVWNWCEGADETPIFGMPAYSAVEYGEPCCSVLLGGRQLWIGTSKGFVVMFCVQPFESVVFEGFRPCVSGAGDVDCEDAGTKAAPHRVWHAHGVSAVRSLLVMSLGRLVWSYGEDQQANVWDVKELLLRGSLQFPCGDLGQLFFGGQHLDAIVWGVCSGSGKLTQFRVREQLLVGSMAFLAPLRRDSSKDQKERCDALGSLVSYLCSLVNPDDGRLQKLLAVTKGASRSDGPYHSSLQDGGAHQEDYGVEALRVPPHVEGALEQLEELYPSSRLLPFAVASLVRGQEIVEASLVGERCGAASFVEGLRYLQCKRQEDAYNIKSLKMEVENERKMRHEAEARLVEKEAEVREQQQQLERLKLLQEECEKHTMALERQLRSAKKAAAVTSAEATRLCEMEASLHEARCTVQGLQDKMESLVRERQEHMRVSQENKSLQVQVRRFELKQQMAKRVVASFIATQDHIVDSLEDIVQLCEVRDHKKAYSDIDTLYEWLCRDVEKQEELFSRLRRSYEAQAHTIARDYTDQ